MKRLARKEREKKRSLDDMIAYVDENGMITSTPPDHKREEVNIEDIEIGIAKRSPDEKIDPIRTGKLSFFNESKGYGFIRDLETNESVFTHANNFLEDIQEGNHVSFELEKGPKGPTAVRVKLSK
jgi:cold shock CspA family protein